MTLPEHVENESLEQKQLRDLPVPKHTSWSSSSGLKCTRKESADPNDSMRVTITEPERFSNLPADIQEEERQKMHEFFFG